MMSGSWRRNDLSAVAKLSPAFFPAPRGRLFAAVGGDESEEYHRNTRLIQEAWGDRVVPVCEALAGANHFEILHDLADPEGRMHRLAAELIGAAA